MIKNRIHGTQNLLSLCFVSFLVGLRTYQHTCSGSTKPRWTDMDSNPFLRCERMAALRLSHGENGTKVLEGNPDSV